MDWASILERRYDDIYDALYRDLSAAFPHPFEWMGLMVTPPWWRFRARAAHGRVRAIFAAHGLVLTDAHAAVFRALPGPGAYGPEDAGGAVVRQLRQTFQDQHGIPWAALHPLAEPPTC